MLICELLLRQPPLRAISAGCVHQVIDDAAGNTLAATSTLNPEIRAALNGAGSNVEAAKMVGAKIAELCKQKNIEKVGVWAAGLPAASALGESARKHDS